eukprot:SAG31_NODE_32776_length_351_cov_10.408730_1_plen_49_part_01
MWAASGATINYVWKFADGGGAARAARRARPALARRGYQIKNIKFNISGA